MTTDYIDVLIVGAGLSGIGAACQLQARCPGTTYRVLEARERMGGTWDLFRYPGVRSDSDMHTLGYNFKPWTDGKAIADGPSILSYIREAAEEHGIEDRIRYRHKAVSASWDSARARWFVEIETPEGPKTIGCRWLHMCTGYYRYDRGYTPDFEGIDAFEGEIIHPQFWPEDYDYSGKKVVVIGSGATAITLVPAMTDKAASVTMLQRSPSYVVSLPARDRLANALRRFLPAKLAYGLTRWKNVIRQLYTYSLIRRFPGRTKARLKTLLREELGADFDLDTHFSPRYDPWDQRLCLVPDSDLFKALRGGGAHVVTDEIERFTANGIALVSGQTLDADLVVTATGLELVYGGGMTLHVDGRQVNINDEIVYRNAMLSGVPNLTNVFGYVNASWTLRADLTSEYMCKMIAHLDRGSYAEVRPVPSGAIDRQDYITFSSSYIQRSIDQFPKQGSEAPWLITQNYARDVTLMRFGKIDDPALAFKRAGTDAREQEPVPVGAAE
ncbi:MAG: NAD(P)/FAD-dependent oxidoreductase [Pseudomonadota bacterium]